MKEDTWMKQWIIDLLAGMMYKVTSLLAVTNYLTRK